MSLNNQNTVYRVRKIGMNRKEFLETLGLGAAFALTSTCLGGCTKDEAPVPKEVDFTIDVSTYANLSTPGGYIIEDDIVIARNLKGEYVAATVLCSHEPNKNIIYKDGGWNCTVHGAKYSESGEGLNAVGANGLTVYKTSLDGNNLRVFS